ncbi:protein kinase domain-containing protein [Planosporangium sp. 12N6]|uniref:serine/threonine-protein kinase n=1 Tax=Planosporangium spinosum TaxID=3402278 RepID=UPI003CF45509
MSAQWPSTGTLLAQRYRLLARIEMGGMAEVWRARDEVLGRPVALKLLAERYAAEGLHHLVHREARAAARLSHPHVAAVHDYAEAVRPDGSVRPFVIMELLGGESLAARLTRGALPWSEAAAIGAATAGALAAAHEQGVVHRDVTPGNVMLTPSGVKVVDFGISAAIGEPDEDSTGITFGTPAYVAPERLDGLPAQAATDVYALGVLLHEMVTGTPPHPANTWEELATARETAPAPLPDAVPAGFAAVVGRCLAEDPGDRPAASEVAAILLGLTQTDRRTDAAPDRATTVPDPAAAVGGAGDVAAGPPSTTRPDILAATELTGSHAAGQAHRALAVTAVAIVAVVVSALAYLAVSLGTRAGAPVPGAVGPATPGTPVPAATPTPGDRRTASASPTPRPRPTGGELREAVDRLRRTVTDDRAEGGIRPDVAQDLLNLIAQLDRTATPERLADLHRKVDDRVREGGVGGPEAEALHAEIDRVAEVVAATGAASS